MGRPRRRRYELTNPELNRSIEELIDRAQEVYGDRAGADARARHLDHRPDEMRQVAGLLGPDLLGEVAEPAQLLGVADERVHDLDERGVAAGLPLAFAGLNADLDRQ